MRFTFLFLKIGFITYSFVSVFFASDEASDFFALAALSAAFSCLRFSSMALAIDLAVIRGESDLSSADSSFAAFFAAMVWARFSFARLSLSAFSFSLLLVLL